MSAKPPRIALAAIYRAASAAPAADGVAWEDMFTWKHAQGDAAAAHAGQTLIAHPDDGFGTTMDASSSTVAAAPQSAQENPSWA